MRILLTIPHGVPATVKVIPDEELEARLATIEERLDAHRDQLVEESYAIRELRAVDADTTAEIKGGPFRNVTP